MAKFEAAQIDAEKTAGERRLENPALSPDRNRAATTRKRRSAEGQHFRGVWIASGVGLGVLKAARGVQRIGESETSA